MAIMKKTNIVNDNGSETSWETSLNEQKQTSANDLNVNLNQKQIFSIQKSDAPVVYDTSKIDIPVKSKNWPEGTFIEEYDICGVNLRTYRNGNTISLYRLGIDGSYKLIEWEYDLIEVRNSAESEYNNFSYIRCEKDGKTYRSIVMFDPATKNIIYVSKPESDYFFKYRGTPGRWQSSIGWLEEIDRVDTKQYFLSRKLDGKGILFTREGVITDSEDIMSQLFIEYIESDKGAYWCYGNNAKLMALSDTRKKQVLKAMINNSVKENKPETCIRNMSWVLRDTTLSEELVAWMFSEKFLYNEDLLTFLGNYIVEYRILLSYAEGFIKDKTTLTHIQEQLQQVTKDNLGIETSRQSRNNLEYSEKDVVISDYAVKDGKVLIFYEWWYATLPHYPVTEKVTELTVWKPCRISFYTKDKIRAYSILSLNNPSDRVTIEDRPYTTETDEMRNKIKTYLESPAENTDTKNALLWLFLSNKAADLVGVPESDIHDMYKDTLLIECLEKLCNEFIPGNYNQPKNVESLSGRQLEILVRYFNKLLNAFEEEPLSYNIKFRWVKTIQGFSDFITQAIVALGYVPMAKELFIEKTNCCIEVLETIPDKILYELGEGKLPFFNRWDKDMDTKLDALTFKKQLEHIATTKESIQNGLEQKIFSRKISSTLYLGALYDVISSIELNTNLSYEHIADKMSGIRLNVPIIPLYGQYDMRESFGNKLVKPDESRKHDLSHNTLKSLLVDYFLIEDHNEWREKYKEYLDNVDINMEMVVFIADAISLLRS